MDKCFDCSFFTFGLFGDTSEIQNSAFLELIGLFSLLLLVVRINFLLVKPMLNFLGGHLIKKCKRFFFFTVKEVVIYSQYCYKKHS